jgi:hypothetical protein
VAAAVEEAEALQDQVVEAEASSAGVLLEHLLQQQDLL